MTCFWDGLLKGLSDEKLWISLNGKKITNSRNLPNFLKQNRNIIMDNVKNITWNNNYLTKQECKEHVDAIENLDINKIGGGYLCSTCDSFLILVCCLFKINIFHKYNSITMSYLYHENDCKMNKSIFVESDRGHFWFVSYVP